MALGATWATMLVTCVIALAYEFPVAVPLLAAGPLVHGAVLSWVVIRALRCPKQLQRPRLDGLMVLSLCFILWFVVLPFVRSTDQVPTVGAFGEAEEDGDRFPGQLP
jgi:hypothetical protein